MERDYEDLAKKNRDYEGKLKKLLNELETANEQKQNAVILFKEN